MSRYTAYQVIPSAWIATRHNELLRPLTVLSGELSVNTDAQLKTKCTATLQTPETVTAYADFLAPFLRVRYQRPNGSWDEISSQIGLFAIPPSPLIHERRRSLTTIEALDLTYLLWLDSFATPRNFSACVNIIASVILLIQEAGFTRIAIPANATTFTQTKTFPPGTSRLDAINTLLGSIGYYTLWTDRIGQLVSMPYLSLMETEPSRTVRSADMDVLGTVGESPTFTRVANKITVIKNNPNDDPLIAIRRNDDPLSPSSTVSLAGPDGAPVVISRVIEDGELADQAAVNAAADRFLQEASSKYNVLSVVTPPDPLFALQSVIELGINRDDGYLVADGRWWWDELTMAFSDGNGTATWRFNRLQPFTPTVVL